MDKEEVKTFSSIGVWIVLSIFKIGRLSFVVKINRERYLDHYNNVDVWVISL